jgi:isoleucyl-tRNA synthetase
MRRVPDIIDVWFDSGISAWASLGYPFRNKDLFEKLWPCDAVSESQDQIRGWFYSLMFCGVSVFNRAPYNSIGLMGWVLDEKGEKMSKSLGNVVWGNEALEKLGADILRLYYCWEVAPWEVQNFSFKTAEEIRRALNILWNSYSFFTIYCIESFKPRLRRLKTEDRWILSKVNSLVVEITNHLENFEFHYAGRKLMSFVLNDLSRFYIKLIRDRVWVSETGEDKLTALSVLHKVLVILAKLFAPITPFISEEIYHNLVCNLDKKAPLSVFQSGWPGPNKKLINKKLEEAMEIAKKIVEACYAARQLAGLKLRWPVKKVLVISKNRKVVQAVKKLEEILLQMCNTKSIKVVEKTPEGEFSEVEFEYGKIFVDKKLDEKLLEEALVRELVREVQALRKKYGLKVKENIMLTLSSDKQMNKTLHKYTKLLCKEIGASKIVIGKLKGKFKGQLKFKDKSVEIAFEKV